MGGSIEVSSPPGCGSSFIFDVVVELPPATSSGAVLAAAESCVAQVIASAVSGSVQLARRHASVLPDGENPLPNSDFTAATLKRNPSVEQGSGLGRAARASQAVRTVMDGTPAALGAAPAEPQLSGAVARVFALSSPIRILMAEDSVVNAMIVAALLKKKGYGDVVMVTNGREAVDAVERGRFSIVLMDCEMPIMDGFAATTEIRRRGNPIPIVAMTANVMYGDRERCLRCGMNDYLPKPVTSGELAACVWKWTTVGNVAS